jgi:hypothetical protein
MGVTVIGGRLHTLRGFFTKTFEHSFYPHDSKIQRNFILEASAGNQNLVSQNIFWSAGMKF